MTIFASQLRSFSPGSKFSGTLQTYFRSGWAFLIPYLAAYLLYAWLKWPVNPGGAGEGMVKAISESESVVSGPWSVVPCLLHVYWFLHAIHLLLGGIALRSWWRVAREKKAAGRKEQDSLLGTHSPLLTTLYKLAPWACLALLFWLPGIYLEWPSDPWEHLRRINEWHILDQVTAHSAWKKSSYFMPYSLTGHVTGLAQLTQLNFFYTGACVLLSWQYYRLARATGLGERTSMLFVVVNALTFGINVFSFYRYYGLSSSIFAQLGAVALTRLAIEAAHRCEAQGAPGRQPLYSLSLSGLGLSALIVFNHLQGLGIAGLGILTAGVWRLSHWKRGIIGWLALAAVIASVATVLWFPRHPAVDEAYRLQGWLTPWYGFNLFSPASPAFDRSLHILGAFGLFNLALSLWLVARRNHVAGWLTLMPVIVLALPCFALPFASVLASEASKETIVAFHRMLLAVPTGLALAATLSRVLSATDGNLQSSPADSPRDKSRLVHPKAMAVDPSSARPPRYVFFLPVALPFALLLALSLPPGSAAYNRLWQSIQISPNDLQLRHLVAFWTPETLTLAKDKDILIIDTPLEAQIQEVFLPSAYWHHHWHSFRQIRSPLNATDLERRNETTRAVITTFDQASTNQDLGSPDRVLLSRHKSAARENHVIATPASSSLPWLTLGGKSPQYTHTSSRAILSNPIGHASHPFHSDLIPVSRYKRYQISTAIRQSGDSSATNYLAVAWYDRDNQLLPSYLPLPDGAAAPSGWVNGTYSYYVLIDSPAPSTWTTYSITFGLGEAAAIPANAAYLRIGALLNYHGTKATVELTDVTVAEKLMYSRLLLSTPTFQHLLTPSSSAAQLSRHWLAQYVFIVHAGTPETRGLQGLRPIGTSAGP